MKKTKLKRYLIKSGVLPLILLSACLVADDSGNKDSQQALAQAAAANSLNRTPNCGTVKGRAKLGDTTSYTLMGNTATDVIQMDFGESTSLTIKATPQNWDIMLEQLNPADCSVSSSSNDFGNNGMEEIEIVKQDGINSAVRIKSGDQAGSGTYSLKIE